MTQKTVDQLSPEQIRVLRLLIMHWPTANDLAVCEPLPPALSTGFMRVSLMNVFNDDLPSDNFWVWRQCNSKITTRLDQNTTAIIQKLNSRLSSRQTSSNRRPSYKLWNIRIIQKFVSFTFLYCEKGITPSIPLEASEFPTQYIFPTEETYTDLLSVDVDSLLDESQIDSMLGL